ncbi:MAG: glycosyltransferase family 2 protein [Candidatus Omnitrophica bacterium]|nr:glycosyltransferase family 2 protein [Candidatus Omnitrophota bacterium]
MKDIKEKVSVIMPAYKEVGHIANSIDITAKTFQDFGCPWELIVVDDGSEDGTYEAALEAAKKYPGCVIVKKNAFNIGKGRALKRAIHFVTGDYTVLLDADMDLHPLQIVTLFDIMRLNNADVVIGSKMHPNSVVNYSLQRRMISLGYYIFVKILFGLPCHDTQTGLKLFKTKVLKDVFPRILVKKFAFDLELLVNVFHLGYKITEASIVLTPQRRFGRVSFSSIYTTWWDTCAVWYRMYVLKYYDRIDYHRRKNLAKEFRRMRR